MVSKQETDPGNYYGWGLGLVYNGYLTQDLGTMEIG